ncbi:MAG: Rrf2 family transcriptional regulator [Pseudomonadota bacterium]
MKISTKGRYGLRVMIHLVRQKDNEPTQMGSIAKHEDISRKYLHSLLSMLMSAGLVRSIRGAKGGYILARPANKILISEVIEALEGVFDPTDCVGDMSVCKKAQDCAARDVWLEVKIAVENVFARRTLDEFAQKKRPPKMYHI